VSDLHAHNDFLEGSLMVSRASGVEKISLGPRCEVM
jgi:hypothetical protein